MHAILERRIRLFPTLVILVLLLNCTRLQAEIYTWKDAQGHTHFGDRPPMESQPTPLKLRINTYTSPEIKLHTTSPVLKDRRKVVMYSTKWCPICKTAKHYFKEKNIPYKEYDVENSQKGRRDFRRLKGQGVPVILVGNQRMNGFSTAHFESLYQQK